MTNSLLLMESDWAAQLEDVVDIDFVPNQTRETGHRSPHTFLLDLPADDGSFFESYTPQAEVPASEISISSPAQPDEKSCPCCKQPVPTPLSNYHKHVSSCFVELQKKEVASLKEETSVTNCIDSIRSNITHLSLHQRISLMESLSRLAHTNTHTRSHSGSVTAHEAPDHSLPSRLQQDDHFAISLLYSTPDENCQDKSEKYEDLKLECSSTMLPPNEASTPSLRAKPGMRPVAPRALSVSSPQFGSSEYHATGHHFRVKRKRDAAQAGVVQALSFCSSYDTDTAPNKVARVAIEV